MRLRETTCSMRQCAVVFSVLAFMLSSSIGTARGAPLKKLGQRINRFALSMYGQLKQKPGNVFFSPYSISTALTMTGLGAAGRTMAEMSRALRLNVGKKAVHDACGRLIAELDVTSPDRGYRLCTANRLWCQKDYDFVPTFLTRAKRYYGAGFEELDFITDPHNCRTIINTWVAQKTQDRIKDLIPSQGVKTDTRMVLTNAIYFKGAWAREFKKAQTRPLPFSTAAAGVKQSPLMSQTGRFGYGEIFDLQILELPYKGDDLSMVVLLPSKASSTGAIEKSLTPSWLGQCMLELSPTKVRVLLPKFKIHWSKELKEPLKKLGMDEAFSPEADFSKMSRRKELYISKVFHKAFVEVNEEGTEAAAATAVVMTRKSRSIEPEPPEFRADRPFLFFIRHRKTETILFLGRLDDPSS